MDPGIYVIGVYVTVAAIGGLFTAFMDGAEDNTDINDLNKEELTRIRIGVSILWPLALAVFIASAPFYGVYKFGQWYGRRL
jgi:hypothetical protein